jgi:hypothetical protein
MKSDPTSNTPQQGIGQSLHDFEADPRWRHGKIVHKVLILATNLTLVAPISLRRGEILYLSGVQIMVSVLLSWHPTNLSRVASSCAEFVKDSDNPPVRA